MKKLLTGAAAAIATVMMVPAVAFAHVVVTPAQTNVGVSTMFNVSVPNEKEVAVTSIKLDIPKGVGNVQPDTLAGWVITTSSAAGNVISIIWTGNIPVGQRADLSFKAQAPANATELDWKAYQTYADGTVVQWDQNPAANGKAVKNNVGPYSVTKVVNDLNSTTATSSPQNSHAATLAIALSIAAIVFSLGSLFLRHKS